MKLLVIASTLAMLAGFVPVSAQELGDAPAHITLPGITFTRALNGAADGASVTSGKLILKLQPPDFKQREEFCVPSEEEDFNKGVRDPAGKNVPVVPVLPKKTSN